MYTQYFGLNEKPFRITPDPRYLFMSERHSEGLAHLVYGVKDSSGFIQLTGEVGTGKTTLVRTLLTRIPKGVEIALILNPQLSAIEFIATICEELKVPLPEDKSSAKALVDALNQHLLESHAKGRRNILLVDEAQNLSTDVLEQIRLLTNLETTKQKLLQIILIAQPELREKLSQTNLRQLAQRVTGRYHLEPLSRDEAERYIDHRLKIAGGLGDIFDENAKREVYKLSKGVPRLINVICDRALLGAYSREERKVSQQIVRKAAEEVSGEIGARPTRRWLLPMIGSLTAIVVAAGIWAMTRAPQSPIVEPVSIPLNNDLETLVTQAETAAPVPAPPPQQPSLDSVLQESVSLTNISTAMATLLSIWNVEYDRSSAPTCTRAEAAGLSCLSKRGSWNVLRQLDKPVVLTLTDSGGQIHSPVVVAINDGTADLIIGEQRLTYPIPEIANVWYGQYLLIWQPPNGDASILQVGARGPKVAWLRQSLAALSPDPGMTVEDSDIFDEDLEQQLLDFQRRNRLEMDGLAGQQTQIIINSLLGLDGRPSLSSGPG
jgi:general secretion pathway protein A